jgi:ankyrin repeat protein
MRQIRHRQRNRNLSVSLPFVSFHSIDPDSKDNDGGTPLSWAAAYGHETVVKLLLATHGVEPNSKDTKYGQTPLYWAASKGYSDVVKLLLEKCKENGIAIRDKEMEIARQLEADHLSRVNCDICMSKIPDIDIHYHCRICSDGDFDVCQECIASGAFCLDQSHNLIKQTVRDGDFVEVPD